MIKNYIKTAIRSLTKNKAYSFLNIFGLSVGIVWVNYDSVNVKNTGYTRFGKIRNMIRIVSLNHQPRA